MDPVLLARIQFALTIGFHFIFLPLTIGLAWLIFAFLTKYKNTGEDFYRRVARFWLRLFVVSFAMGVATGITMEFQFGTNWSEYSRFVGDIFGAPLAAEGIFAFFLESVFIGVLIFGWKRLSVKTTWFSAGRVAQLHRHVSVLIEPLRPANRTYRARNVRSARRALPGGEAEERGSAECPVMGQCGGYALFWLLLLISVAATARTQPQLMQNYNAHLALWLLPLVIGYTVWAYRAFSGKVSLEDGQY